MKLRLALIAPQMGYDKNEYKNKDKKVLPLGIYTLKSYLNQFYSNITLIDAITEEYSEDEIIDIITKNECNIIGISGITNKYYNSILSLAKKLKQIKTILFVFVGGPIATFCYDILLKNKNIDFIIRGEGEIILKNVLDCLSNDKEFSTINGICFKEKDSNNIIVNPFQERMKTFDLFRKDKYSFNEKTIAEFISGSRSYVIMASRGCKGNCVFCQVPKYYGQKGIFWRNVKDVVDEIEYAIIHWGVRRFNFQDSNFLCEFSWVNDFINEVVNRKISFIFNIFADAESVNCSIILRLKKIGLYQVFVGLETGSKERFQKLKKKAIFEDNQNSINIIKKSGLKIIPGYILYYPDSTLKEIIDSANWFKNNNMIKPSMYFNKMDVWYGTDMYDYIESNGCIISSSINDGVIYKFLDNDVNELYNYMMMGLKKFKIIWGKITSENNIRRTILTEQVINELENGKNINFLKDKIDIYYSNKEKYTFGRSKDNEKILSEIVDLYFWEAVKCVQIKTISNKEKELHLNNFADNIIQISKRFVWLSQYDLVKFKETIKEIFYV